MKDGRQASLIVFLSNIIYAADMKWTWLYWRRLIAINSGELTLM